MTPPSTLHSGLFPGCPRLSTLASGLATKEAPPTPVRHEPLQGPAGHWASKLEHEGHPQSPQSPPPWRLSQEEISGRFQAQCLLLCLQGPSLASSISEPPVTFAPLLSPSCLPSSVGGKGGGDPQET